MELNKALDTATSILSDFDQFVRVVLSGRRRNMETPALRIDIRPVQLKSGRFLQVMSNDGKRTTTKNFAPKDPDVSALLDSGYANILAESTEQSISIRITKKGEALINISKSVKAQNLSHDRSKARLLDPSDPFLIEVGISDRDGKVKPSRQDKFMQVEEFLRILVPALNNAISAGQIQLPTFDEPLRIVDLGCGHAYLTFAAHQYLRAQGIPVQVVGIDIREESRKRNSDIAEALGISETIEFRAEEIAATKNTQVDIAIALHACDTATDDALAWAVVNDATLILSAPCCHHDIQAQLSESPEPWNLVTRHGLLKERLGDILTDALRVHILKILGYRTETIEFIGGQHTPRNLMIRAVKTNAKPDLGEIELYETMISTWKVRPALANRLAGEMAEIGVK